MHKVETVLPFKNTTPLISIRLVGVGVEVRGVMSQPLFAQYIPKFCTPSPFILFWYDEVFKWKHFPRYWPFLRGIHRSPVNSPQKGQWRGPLMFSLICAWIDGWVNNGEAGDLRRYRAYYDVIVMIWSKPNGRCSYLSGLLQWHWGDHEQTMKIGLIQWSHFKLLEFSIWRKILGQTRTLCTAYFLFMAKQGLSQWEKTLHMCVTRLGPCSSISRKRAHIAWTKS